MSITTKTLRKVAAVIEDTYGTYKTPTTLLPFTAESISQKFSMIEDASITGQNFKDLPVQGIRDNAGSLESQVDVLTLPVLLEAACGAAGVAGVYTPVTVARNLKSLSLCCLDGVKTVKKAGICVNNFKISSSAEGDLKASLDGVSSVAEVRDDTSFPTPSIFPGVRLVHRHAEGTGYIRIGDQADALASGDNQKLTSFECTLNPNFILEAYNSQSKTAPVSCGMEAGLSFTIAEHDADTFFVWRDNLTALQLKAYFYVSSAASLLIEIPNFIVSEVAVTEDDKAKQTVTCMVARNGIGSSYSNANMTFNAPIRYTIDNS